MAESKRNGRVDLRKLPYMLFRKLGRERNDGEAYHPAFSGVDHIPHPMLIVDSRTRNRMRVEMILHEALHLALPALPEHEVESTARYLAKVFWHLGYRADEEAQNDHYDTVTPLGK